DPGWVQLNQNLISVGGSTGAGRAAVRPDSDDTARPSSKRASATFGTQIVTAVAFSQDFNGRANVQTGYMFAGVWGGGVFFRQHPGDSSVDPTSPCPSTNASCWQVNLTGMANTYPRA